MLTGLCEMIQWRGLTPEGMACTKAVLEFRHAKDKPLNSPVNAHHEMRRQCFLAQARTPPRPVRLELKCRAPEYHPSSKRLLQLLIDKRMPEPVLNAASLGLPVRSAGVMSW